jgi:hypothetical protein
MSIRSENDDPNPPVLSTGKKKVRAKDVDLSIRDDHEEGEKSADGVLGPLVGTGEHGLQLCQLDQHPEERPGHGLRRQYQHFTPSAA